jgi:hypothetical protein
MVAAPDFGRRSHRQTITHRRAGAGDAGNENPARLARSWRAGVIRKLSKEERAGLKWWAEKYVDNGAYCLKHGINVGGATLMQRR